jgi:hypothetical protein
MDGGWVGRDDCALGKNAYISSDLHRARAYGISRRKAFFLSPSDMALLRLSLILSLILESGEPVRAYLTSAINIAPFVPPPGFWLDLLVKIIA